MPLSLRVSESVCPFAVAGAAAGVKRQPAAPQAHILLDEPAACQAAYPRLQLLQMERLGQIIVRTGIQSVHLVGNFASRRQYEHAGFLIVLPQGSQNGHTVHLGQIQIEQHQIAALHRQQLERRFSVSAGVRLITGQAQFFRNIFAQITLVLYHQKPHELSSFAFSYLYYTRQG